MTRTREVLEQVTVTEMRPDPSRDRTIIIDQHIDVVSDRLTVDEHGMKDGEWIRIESISNARLPMGLTPSEMYIVKRIDDDHISLFRDQGLEKNVDFTEVGTGELKLLSLVPTEVSKTVAKTVQEQYSVNTRRLFKRFSPSCGMNSSEQWLTHAVFGPDSESILAVQGSSGRVFDGQLPWGVRELVGTSSSMEGFSINRDGSRAATYGRISESCENCGCGTIELWDTQTGKNLQTLNRPGERILGGAFDPTLGHLIVAADDRPPQAIPVLAPAPLPPAVGAIGIPNAIVVANQAMNAVSNSVVGQLTGTQNFLYLLDPQTGQIVHRFGEQTGLVEKLAVADEGPRMVTVDQAKILRVWDLAKRSVIHTQTLAAYPLHLSISPDGTLVFLIDSQQIAKAYLADDWTRGVQLGDSPRGVSLIPRRDRLAVQIGTDKSHWELATLLSRADKSFPVIQPEAQSESPWLSNNSASGDLRLKGLIEMSGAGDLWLSGLAASPYSGQSLGMPNPVLRGNRLFGRIDYGSLSSQTSGILCWDLPAATRSRPHFTVPADLSYRLRSREQRRQVSPPSADPASK